MGVPSDEEIRRGFLAARDVACPRCRYNLRDSPGDTCPECGLKIVLEVAGRRAWSVPAMFAFFAFGWALAAGLMNSVRNVKGLYDQACAPVVQTLLAPRGSRVISYGSYGGEFSWSALGALPWREWVEPVWSVSCALLAVVGLALAWRAVRSATPKWIAARVTLIVLYGVYGGYHVLTFAQQVWYWF